MKKQGRIKRWAQKLAIKTLFSVDQSGGWVPIIRESFTGAYQTNDPLSVQSILAHPTVYACVSQIAYDVGKLKLDITRQNNDGIYSVTVLDPYTSLLKRPNKYQIRQKFIEYWLVTLLVHGNAYILKGRGDKGKVKELHVLDPDKIEPLVADDGSVFYRIRKDRLPVITRDIDAIPASEIIHDTMITLFHPLVGISPLFAADLAAQQGLSIANHSVNFFDNKAQPGGILTAPGHIKKEVADRIRDAWADQYSGENAGKIAVLGDGLRYDKMAENAADSELIGQLDWSDEKICSCFKVPPYKVHVGKPPTYEQSETLDRKYYSDCLQVRIEAIEALLDDGMRIPENFGTRFRIEDLMRMDLSLRIKTEAEGVKAGIYAPNESRKRLNHKPVKGGDSPYMQQQNYSLEALARRDEKDDPFSGSTPNISPDPETDETEKLLYELIKKDISGVNCG